MPTDSPIFVGLLVGVILIVGALSFFPALALGPVAEALDRRGSASMSDRPAARCFDGPIVRRALVDALRKLDPRALLRNPVMFVGRGRVACWSPAS